MYQCCWPIWFSEWFSDTITCLFPELIHGCVYQKHCKPKLIVAPLMTVCLGNAAHVYWTNQFGEWFSQLITCLFPEWICVYWMNQVSDLFSDPITCLCPEWTCFYLTNRFNEWFSDLITCFFPEFIEQISSVSDSVTQSNDYSALFHLLWRKNKQQLMQEP